MTTSTITAPTKLARELLTEHVEHFKATTGFRNEDMVDRLENKPEPNNITQWCSGKSKLPLHRIPQLAKLMHLSEQETQELLAARVLELFGKKAELSEELMSDLLSIGADLNRHPVVALWDAAASPAPALALGYLEAPDSRARIQAGLNQLLQAEFQREEAEARS